MLLFIHESIAVIGQHSCITENWNGAHASVNSDK